MTQAEMNSYRRKLLALKTRLGGDLTELEEAALRPIGGDSSGNLSDVPVHPADLGDDTFDEEMSLILLENEVQLLEEVNDALTRIEQCAFGRCEACGEEIAQARLRVLPYARYCLRDAQRLQGSIAK